MALVLASVERPSAEMEAAFYVDFDFKTGLFVLPQESVTATEAHSRLATLAYLGLKAAVLHDVLFAEDPKFRLSVFSGIAFRMCTEEIFQQDMPGILEQFAEGSARHRALVEDLHRGFAVKKIRHSPSAASTSAEAERERN
jgi:hypothetical protein